MKPLATFLLLLLLFVSQPVLAQQAAPALSAELRAQYEAAYFAWDRGDYVEAMERAEEILTSGGGEALAGPLAQLTGELYPVAEVAPDGRAVRWSPEGRYAAYETGSGVETRTHIVAVGPGGAEDVAVVDGQSAVFSPDGQLAYLQVPETEDVDALRQREEQAMEAGDYQEVRRLRMQIAQRQAEAARVRVLDPETGEETDRTPQGLDKIDLAYAGDGTLILIGRATGETDRTNLYALSEGEAPRQLTQGPGAKGSTLLAAGTERLVYTVGNGSFVVHELGSGEEQRFEGSSLTVSADGSTLAYLRQAREVDDEIQRGAAIAGADVRSDGHLRALHVLRLDGDRDPQEVKRTTLPLSSPALSQSGDRVAYMQILRDDWEVFVSESDGSGETRVTRDIQHDYYPEFLTEDRLYVLMGESRHRRAYMYDLSQAFASDGAALTLPGRDQRGRVQLFHNNQLRTVSPQYDWAGSPDGSRMLIVADRDGDTVSPERGVYLVDLSREVTREEVLERVRLNLAQERDLRERGREMFAPIEAEVRAATEEVDAGRIYDYAHALHQFDSKWFEEPGNQRAIEYLEEKLRQMGYEPELQWFNPRDGEHRSANVVATLEGTTNPEQVYLITSHFDSVPRSPGADDNSSASTAMLEAARVLADRPQAATIKFVLLTAEEAGLLGAREYVRRALDEGEEVAGVINNDMVGWTRSHRLDNTIRYSNASIRDIQHTAAIQFSDLITYDARYVRGTDAHVFFDAYGDIIGGTGSYPILSNPHYHQPHDMLEGIDQRLVAAVSKTTVAAIMRLASSPTPLTGLDVEEASSGTFEVSWTPAGAADLSHYEIAYGPLENPLQHRQTVEVPEIVLEHVQPGWQISVRAVNERDLTGWEWATATVPGARAAR